MKNTRHSSYEKEIGYFRIVTYNESTRPVIQFYEKESLVKRIDASNDVDKVKVFFPTKTGMKLSF